MTRLTKKTAFCAVVILGWVLCASPGRAQDDVQSLRMEQMNISNKGMFNSEVSYSQDLDIEETKDNYMVKVDTSGFDPNKIDINIQGDTLTICGQTRQSSQEKGSRADSFNIKVSAPLSDLSRCRKM